MLDQTGIARRDAFLAALSRRPLVMGILNVTPDSFSDGGLHAAHDDAARRAGAMAAEGADVIDIGGESTRPGATPVTAEDELARIGPVLDALCPSLDVPVSVDTYKARVAREAVRRGAVIVNDVWGLARDPGMADAVAQTGAALVIMHNRESVDPDIDILDDVERVLGVALERAARAGVPRERILIDPGIGFGKSVEQNLACLRALPRLRRLGCPVLVGVSRKSMFGRLLGRPVDERLPATLATNMACVLAGAAVIRVHDVAPHVDALAMLRATGALSAAATGEPA
ncbi:dihydropteroate synthase [Salinarimonas ramus]|uniref:Dihydropteroate synthase n=1 Tax=Salinarimonas ramus TaxID=690164 RepID=A0A917QDJ7_9HYPH|nr:dihydropteroate synthase [Salinarimonas ramus]GGK45523.1 dihydropteroate synthase [Salinarimonas ramus]